MIFAFLFFLSCLIFWWLPYFIYRFANIGHSVSNETLINSVIAFISFIAGYFIAYALFNKVRFRPLFFGDRTLNNLAYFTEKALIAIAPVCIVFAISFFLMRLGHTYGEGPYMPFVFQLFFYMQIFLYYIYATVKSTEEYFSRKFIYITFTFLLTRLIVSLQWGRLFLAYSIVPLFLLLVARGVLQFNLKTVSLLFFAFVFLFFLIPLFRGDFERRTTEDIIELAYVIAYGGPIGLFDMYKDLSFKDLARYVGIEEYCNPLIVSVTAWLIPYKLIGECVLDIWQAEDRPATLDRIFAFIELGPKRAFETLYGPGSVYILELYFSFGESLIMVYLGSFVMGSIAGISFTRIRNKSIFGVAYLEILFKILFMPRSNVGQVFEKAIPFAIAVMILALILNTLERFRFKRN